MREIKFRAWSKYEEQMLAWEDIEAGSEFRLCQNWKRAEESGLAIMQFTGLKDKNGKEIYEGDVVKHRRLDGEGDMILYGVGTVLEGDAPMKVEWSHCGFRPFAGWIDDAQTDFQWEIIGNIYENPELLSV